MTNSNPAIKDSFALTGIFFTFMQMYKFLYFPFKSMDLLLIKKISNNDIIINLKQVLLSLKYILNLWI